MKRIELADNLEMELSDLKAKFKKTDLKKKEFELSINKLKTEMNSLKTMEKGWKDAAKAVHSSAITVQGTLDAQYEQIMGGLKGKYRDGV